MNSKLKTVIYAFSAFFIFMILTWVLRLAAGKLPVEDGLWGVFKSSDLFLGLVVAVVITFSHLQKRRLK